MDKLYYTISQAADILSESTSLVRYWSNSFPQIIKPRRNAKGNRLFTQEDIEYLRRIHYLVKSKGMTLEGASKTLLQEDKALDKKIDSIQQLQKLKETLLKIRRDL